MGNYSPLFNPLTYKPHKAYYAFTAFNELRKRGTAGDAARQPICRITDADRTDAEIPLPAELPPHSFAVIQYANSPGRVAFA